MSERNVEYRVRAVTRYIVTAHDDTSTQEVGEYKAVELASGAAAALAFSERENGANALFVPYEGPPPGRVMRCKVVLHSRMPQWGMNADEKGNYLGRTIEVPAANGYSAHTKADPTDPANVKRDGERIMFAAVAKGFDKDGNNNADENRIFGFWSPTFSIDGHVRNEAVLANLEQGAEYYVDFTPAPK